MLNINTEIAIQKREEGTPLPYGISLTETSVSRFIRYKSIVGAGGLETTISIRIPNNTEEPPSATVHITDSEYKKHYEEWARGDI